MCCLLSILAVLGPRAALAIWWLADQSWFNRIYDTFIWPFLGFIFLPFTTLMWTLVASPATGVTGFNWVWIILAVIIDIATYSGGGYGNRNRIPGYSSRPTGTI
jgi:hypothetical protein